MIDDLLLRQAVGKDFNGVFRLAQGTDFAGGVFVIALRLVGQNLLERRRFAALVQVGAYAGGRVLPDLR